MKHESELTAEQVAARLGISVETARRRARLLGARKQRAGWVFSESRVRAFERAAKRVSSGPEAA
jgi:hypothetical protein